MAEDKSNKDPLMTSKIIGTICVAGLVFLFGRWGAEALTSRGMPDEHHGEGEHEVVQAYTIEVAESGGDGGEEHGGDDVGALMAAADPAKGEAVFGKCKACHALEPGKNGTGPSLAGIYNRVPGTEAGFAFSDAMVAFGSGHKWDVANLFAFLGDVKGTVPGTKMSFNGISKPEQKANLIAFLMGSEFNAGDFSGSESASEGASEEAASEEVDGNAEPAAEETAAAGAEVAKGTGDAVKGEKVFKKCKACHKVGEGEQGTGPTMFGVSGRNIGSLEGFSYSSGMAEHGGVWDAASLDAFLADPKSFVPGTKMSFPGLKKEQDRVDIIAYLETLK